MKRSYLIFPAAAFIAFLTFYIPEERARRADFSVAGPGRVHEFRVIRCIRWSDRGRLGILGDPAAIQRILTLIGIEFETWERSTTVDTRPTFALSFTDADSSRWVPFWVGYGFVHSEKYSKALPVERRAAILKELEANSKIYTP